MFDFNLRRERFALGRNHQSTSPHVFTQSFFFVQVGHQTHAPPLERRSRRVQLSENGEALRCQRAAWHLRGNFTPSERIPALYLCSDVVPDVLPLVSPVKLFHSCCTACARLCTCVHVNITIVVFALLPSCDYVGQSVLTSLHLLARWVVFTCNFETQCLNRWRTVIIIVVNFASIININ